MSLTPEQESAHGRHRIRRLGGPAGVVTATIAAGSVALAAFAASSTGGAPAESARAAVGQTDPQLAADPVASVSPETGAEAGRAYAEARALRAEQGAAALTVSTDLTSTGVDAVREASEAISAQKRAEREAAKQAAAEQAAAEQAAAEQAAAEQAAAEQAAAEQAAAEQAAAEREAAARQQAEAASRSAERAPAPEPAPAQQQAPAPAPAPAPVSSGDARSIARSMLSSYGWGDDQWGCLDSLWQRESGWSHTATNPSSGAYGIPQSLPAGKMASAGADWQTNPATQIAWGLGYISERYGSPCNAWAHSEAVNWY
ncbi:lytic transglycosylase domain-containing protein [Ornithinimicrobium pekingense]|uniref:Lytic transglycosylase domain-containing protein n=1 Tax=Ornithinimicrobium pekingense TaxID=384677 RepID=A0ABQ2FD85_9MICO|nr:lytic transglycosylase domain-containing protein [Ornithinimicrobium pekingense]GGK80903.1 hypothetical protein GCM10011509_31750 [Ornithinimicrobium pekingense]